MLVLSGRYALGPEFRGLDGERGVIGKNGADADHNSIALPP